MKISNGGILLGFGALLGCCAILGCGVGDGAQRAAVHGTVTLDGQPIENGAVQFEPTQGTTGPVAGATIENGHYSVPQASGPVLGANLVKISGVHKTGKRTRTPTGQIIDEYAPAIPSRYGKNSTLVVQIELKDNVCDFPLTSK